jgi:hypothetical protein
MEIFVEILLTLLGDVLAAFLTSVFDGRRPMRADQHAGRLVGYVILGAIAGWVSVMLLPSHVLTNESARRAWLAVSPIAAACAVFVFHWLFFPRERRGWPMVHAAALAAAFTTWRFFAL